MFTPEELRQAKIFACLDEAECARMAQNAADVRLKAGEWLVRSGEAPWFYVLYEGRLRIVADIQGISTEFPEYDFTAGDFLGEVPLLLRTPVFNSARAQTPCRIARLDKQQFFQLIRDSKEARAMVLEVLGERLLRIQERSLSLMTSRVLIFGRNKDAVPLETSLPGVFCAGDVRHNSIKRVSSGVGEGSMAIAFIHQYLALQEKS